jgi:hypothetical protein
MPGIGDSTYAIRQTFANAPRWHLENQLGILVIARLLVNRLAVPEKRKNSSTFARLRKSCTQELQLILILHGFSLQHKHAIDTLTIRRVVALSNHNI